MIQESIIHALEISWKRIGAIAIIAILVFLGFYKEKFLINSLERKHLKLLQQKSRSRYSGRVLLAIIGFLLVLISLLIGYIFYSN
ncbi:hypothetical protein GCM10022393_20770 [Aquimarina addita]|uniref:Uncharacterized protein n=1 Tax=Aquimarina addita TaxID=870485 RepID=A0ABP6ULA4_9FLAO